MMCAGWIRFRASLMAMRQRAINGFNSIDVGLPQIGHAWIENRVHDCGRGIVMVKTNRVSDFVQGENEQVHAVIADDLVSRDVPSFSAIKFDSR